MRTTVNLDDELMATAAEMTGIEEKLALLRDALKALIARESACRLARPAGKQPGLRAPARRRFPSDDDAG